MLVKELIEKLNKLNPELKVFISSDEEGNSFSGNIGISIGMYQDYGDEVNFTSWEIDEDGEEIYPPVPVTEDIATAICIWP